MWGGNSPNMWNYYPVSTDEIAPPHSKEGNLTFDLEHCGTCTDWGLHGYFNKELLDDVCKNMKIL
jgi:hypothetical protein